MDSKPKKIVTTCLIKYLDMQDFAEVALISDSHLIGWMEGFYTIFDIHPIYNQESNSLLLYVPRVLYSPREYHRFIKIKNDGKYDFKEEFPELVGSFIVKVVKHEPYEMDIVSRAVLKKIKQIEKVRKS
jgi:hypothetical protein